CFIRLLRMVSLHGEAPRWWAVFPWQHYLPRFIGYDLSLLRGTPLQDGAKVRGGRTITRTAAVLAGRRIIWPVIDLCTPGLFPAYLAPHEIYRCGHAATARHGPARSVGVDAPHQEHQRVRGYRDGERAGRLCRRPPHGDHPRHGGRRQHVGTSPAPVEQQTAGDPHDRRGARRGGGP